MGNSWFIFYIYVIIITYTYSEWILILSDIVWYLSECSECLSPLLSLLNVSSFESRPCDGPFNETRACAHAGRKEIQTVQYDPRVSRCLKEIIWWLPMIVYDLWAVRRQALGLTIWFNAFFFRIWCSKTVILDRVRLPAREATHNDVRCWGITKCHPQEHSEHTYSFRRDLLWALRP